MTHSTFLICAIGLLAAPDSGISPADEPPLFPDTGCWGVVVHTPYRAQALKDIGVQWVRLTLRWNNVETGERGRYDWTETDKLLNYYLENGFHVIAVLTLEDLCPLYEPDKENKELVIKAASDWCAATAERYKGKGILWELGNEPEVFPMGGYWNDPLTYASMAQEAAALIKKADPEAKVGAMSVAWMDRPFVKKALESGMLKDSNIDVITYHGYHRHTLLPESGLAEDVAWLREQIRANSPPGKTVVPVDSERGYAIVPFLEEKKWDSWRNLTYSESEQAAYLARHYLETISLGVEIAVWYKDMRGESCFSLYYDTEEDPRGLRPCGHVFRNLAHLLPLNPKKMMNQKYPVSLVATDKPLDEVQVRSYLVTQETGQRLVVAAWNPVEAFDGKILDNRKRIGDSYYEAWRAQSPDDVVDIPARVRIEGLAFDRVAGGARYDILSKATEGAMSDLALENAREALLSPTLSIGPTPVILVVDIKP